MSSLSQLTEVAIDQAREDAFTAGYDDAMAGHANRYEAHQRAGSESIYRDGYALGVYDRMKARDRLVLVTNPVGRSYKARHRRVAS